MKNAYQTKHTLPPTIPPQTTCLPHGADIFQEKGLDVGQELHCRDWVGVLGTETFLNSNLVTPENFVQFYPFVQKLFMIFFNLDGRTNSIQNKSPLYPIQVWVEIFCTLFSTSHKTKWAPPPFCLDNNGLRLILLLISTFVKKDCAVPLYGIPERPLKLVCLLSEAPLEK